VLATLAMLTAPGTSAAPPLSSLRCCAWLRVAPLLPRPTLRSVAAELGAAFLCVDLGIPRDVREDHAAYIATWLKALRDDKRLIVSAASHAQRAVDYLHGLQANAGDGIEARQEPPDGHQGSTRRKGPTPRAARAPCPAPDPSRAAMFENHYVYRQPERLVRHDAERGTKRGRSGRRRGRPPLELSYMSADGLP